MRFSRLFANAERVLALLWAGPHAGPDYDEASLHAIRSETATRISAGKDRLAAFSRIPTNIDQFRNAIGRSFQHLRGWACTALAAHTNFHLESGLFDLVIVDEASQCSLAAVLPLAYRAKRLAVVGDPYQLYPIISLSDRLLEGIAHGVGFENTAAVTEKRGITRLM